MKSIFKIIITIIAVLCLLSCNSKKLGENDFSFIVTTDWRQFSKPEYHNSNYFQGALEAISKVGKGDFMLSPGDVEPQWEALALIEKILGQDYPWYPLMGNHELEDPSYVQWLRDHNAGGNTLPNVVNVGPDGSKETTFSFDWGDCHFVYLNQYFDGVSDTGTDGEMVPELLEWLEKDLKENTKKYCIVTGHEPIVSMPDKISGRIRHRGDSLDKYPLSTREFFNLMMEYKVNAYMHGHTHSTAIGKINGLWRIDPGHAKGIEDVHPRPMLDWIYQLIDNGYSVDDALVEVLAKENWIVKKTLYYMNLLNGESYKTIDDVTTFPILKEFFVKSEKSEEYKNTCIDTFWENRLPTFSTFLKVWVSNDGITVDVYRKPFDTIEYSKVDSYKLN